MKKIFKLSLLIAILIVAVINFTGCNAITRTKSYTYKIETGDMIEVSMDIKGGYNLTSQIPIKFSKNDKTISQGSFYQEYAYNMYSQRLKSNSNVKIIKESEKDGNKYIFWTEKISDGTEEYNYLIKIKNSKTVFLLENNKSKSDAEDIFDRLEISVDDDV